MRSEILQVMLLCLISAGPALCQDTTWIDPTFPGALETAINSDITASGTRAHPNTIYGLHKDAVYIQKTGIVFTGGGTLSIVGEKGGGYPVVQMQHVSGSYVPSSPNMPVANTIEGSLCLDHVYWLGKGTEGTLYASVFNCTTANQQAQALVLNDCIMEFVGTDWVTAQGWDHGARFRITNCYFRALFSGEQWWTGRVFYCKQPIDTIWVENCTVTNGGLTFALQGAVTRFAYFNHNTFINATKYWLLNCYYLNLFIANNLFVNQNWVGEDTINVTTSGFDPDHLLMGTVNIDTITSSVVVQPELQNPDGTVNPALVGPDKMKIFASNNIFWTDSLLDAYYTNRNNAWNTVGPYPLSYLNWAGNGIGPWRVTNVPSIWANQRTLALFAAYPHNMAMTQNKFARVNTVTPGIANAGIATLMAQWNQNQWNDPNWASLSLRSSLVNSSYVPGDKDANTLPGFTNGAKDENGRTTGLAKVSDFIENYSQAGVPVLSVIDQLPIGSLQWNNQTVPADAYAEVHAAFVAATGYVPPLPPPAPVALPATVVTYKSFAANWNNSDRAAMYLLDVATDSTFDSVLVNYRNISAGNNLAAAVTGLSGSTRYFYRVRGSNEGGSSGNSNVISVTTVPAPPPPAAPVAGPATHITSTSFMANWDSVRGAIGYLLTVAADTSFDSVLTNYHSVGVGNELTAGVTGLSGGRQYSYRVQARNDGGAGGNSNVIEVMTEPSLPVDTIWIDPSFAGALEKTINADTLAGGLRAHPNAAYGLHKDGIYIQNAGIVFKGGSTLTIVGEKGGAYPVVQMQPVNGVNPGDLTNGIANKVEGSLHLDHVYWLAKTTDGTGYNQLFGTTTINRLPQSCVVNDCIVEFPNLDVFNGDGWRYGSVWRFTNCYFRNLFNGTQWWAGRVMNCKRPIDTIWVENCTVSGGGLIFLQQDAVTRFALFNHNTFINATKTWLPNKYFVNLFVASNLFTNHNWVGEDSVNTNTGGSDPDGLWTGTINIDSITIRQQLFPDMIAADSTADQTRVGLNKLRIFVTDNICWTDTLLNSYYVNYSQAWNTIGPYPVSYLTWGGRGSGPWRIKNIPGIWANNRTMNLFATYSFNMLNRRNSFSKRETVTPSIANAGIVTLMGKWNQNQWSDPAKYPNATANLLASSYCPGDQDASTIPGYTNGVKSENAQTSRVTKIPDFIESYAQAGIKVNSTIDGLPVGALAWDDQTVPASSSKQILNYYSEVVIAVGESQEVVGSFTLDQNYPNPFNPSTIIRYAIPHRSHVNLNVYNLLGQEVASLVDGIEDPGINEVKFDGSNLASGVYFYRIIAGSFVQTRKLLLIR